MVFLLVEVLGKVSVKDRSTAKTLALVAVGVTSASDVVTGIDEFKIIVVGSAEKTHRRRILRVAVLVGLDLVVDGIAVLGRMKRIEDSLDELFLVLVEGAGDPVFRMDVPPVADVLPSLVIAGKGDLLSWCAG